MQGYDACDTSSPSDSAESVPSDKTQEDQTPQAYLAAAQEALDLAHALAGQGGPAAASARSFLMHMARSDALMDHDAETCGICHQRILGAQVARELLQAGSIAGAPDAIERWSVEATRRWQDSKFFRLWQEELAAGRDPHEAFKARGWEP